jgi:hypothetical protein
MEKELRQMFERKGAEMSVPSTLSPGLRNRVGRQRMVMGGLIAATAVAVVVGGFAGARSLSSDDAAPVRPAEERKQETEPMRNGRVLYQDADSMYWDGAGAPPPPGGDHSYHWAAFDQDTGSFLYTANSHVWVVNEHGRVADLVCLPESNCGSTDDAMSTFGPDPDEITVPSADGRSAHVIGFDRTLRDTLDISAVLSPGQDLSDLAWSPDGKRLAVITDNVETYSRCTAPCGSVWIFDRAGGEPRLVYTERTTGYSVLRDPAWSPDGDTLALLVGPPSITTGTGGERWPRLMALRVGPDEPVRAERLWVYDDSAGANESILSIHYLLAFPFAWSPDGTRIAVLSGGGIAEISAEDGEVLDRHDPGEEIEGPLAWLRKA